MQVHLYSICPFNFMYVFNNRGIGDELTSFRMVRRVDAEPVTHYRKKAVAIRICRNLDNIVTGDAFVKLLVRSHRLYKKNQAATVEKK